MGVPNHGVYTSEDGVQTIQITGANSSNGQITGTYTSTSSPAGEFSVSGNIGGYMWVKSKETGRDGAAPFLISFTASKRPTGRPYAMKDSWVGGYKTDNTLWLAGSRSYVNEHGEVQSVSLGTKKFSQ